MIVDVAYCARNIRDVHGLRGAAWLAALPALLDEFAGRWSLTIGPPFPVLSYNYVAPVSGPGDTSLVLKAGVPHGELWSEIEALRVFDGRGIARLLAADRERGVLLLERVLPGRSLREVVDVEAQIAALAGVLRQLWRPLPGEHPFRTIDDLAHGFDRLRATFDGGYGPFPGQRIERATALLRELASDGTTLIHGDMNPGNVLRGEREEWLAIDPKGYAGHPYFDVATFLNDPPDGLSAAGLRRLQARRVTALAGALGAPRDELLAWAEAHATLSAWWRYEDHGAGWEPTMALAAMYEALGRAPGG
ncbi:MAG: phosphotransferase [Candidatus Promineofilum sp.]|nr:phosphotransferase [Promineifilum sp.]